MSLASPYLAYIIAVYGSALIALGLMAWRRWHRYRTIMRDHEILTTQAHHKA